MKLRTGLFIAAACAVIPVADAVTFFGPSAYLSAADIPAGLYAGGSPLFLENFEDSSLDGGITASQFLEAGLVDELTISIIAMVLGSGIPLFSVMSREHQCCLVSTQSFS